MKFKDFFVSFDQFGSIFNLSIQGTSREFKSVYGALASILINLTAVGYFIYLMWAWQSGSLLPKVTTNYYYAEEGSQISLNESPFIFNIEDFYEQFNTINKKGYVVNQEFFVDGETIKKDSFGYKCPVRDQLNYDTDMFEYVCVNVEDENQQILKQNPTDRDQDTYLGYYIYPCDEEEEENCYDQEMLFIDDVAGRLTTYVQEYNFDRLEMSTLPSDHYYYVTDLQTTVITMKAQITELTICKGFLFPQYERFTYINKIEIGTTFYKRKSYDTYFDIELTLDRIKRIQKMEYPKLPEILAQFSSIFSALMAVGILFSYFNNILMKNRFLDKIGNLYFSNYMQIMNRKDFKKDNSRIIPENFLDPKERDHINQSLMEKSNLLNIIFEISKLQLSLFKSLRIDEIHTIQRTKYKLSRKLDMKSSIEKSNTNQKEAYNQTHFQIFDRKKHVEAFQSFMESSREEFNIVSQEIQTPHNNRLQFLEQIIEVQSPISKRSVKEDNGRRTQTQK